CIFFFSHPLSLPRRSPVFPYTTLFRSCLFNLLTFPVRVMVCHWSRILPVVRIKGRWGLRGSKVVFGPETAICARPLGVGNILSVKSLLVPPFSLSTNGH